MSRQIRNPVTGWWEKVPEPRWTSVAWAAAYVVLGAAGASVLLDPPLFLWHGIGGVLTVYWAWLLILGGLLGMFSAPTGWYIVERIAVLCIAVALAMYTAAVVTLYLVVVDTNLLYQVLIDSALVIVVAGRWAQVRWGVRDPERYSTYTPPRV